MFHGLTAEAACAYPTTPGKYAWTLGSTGPTWDNPNIVAVHPLAQPNSLRVETNSTVGAKFGITTPQTVVATNGLASQAANSPLVIAATGITNTLTANGFGINAVAMLNVTNVSYVLINSARTAWYTSSVMNACIAVPLQPGAAVTNTSGLSGKLVPW